MASENPDILGLLKAHYDILVVSALTAEAHIQKMLDRGQTDFKVEYYGTKGALLFVDTICTDEAGNVMSLLTHDAGKGMTDYSESSPKGHPIWEVIADGVHCKLRPGALSFAVFPLDLGEARTFGLAEAMNRPDWAV